MCARGAMKTPWLSLLYKQFPEHREKIDNKKSFLNHTRRKNIPNYFNALLKKCDEANIQEKNILSRFKSLSRYLFDDLPGGQQIRGSILRSKDLNELQTHLNALS